jgi:hypothetical protein
MSREDNNSTSFDRKGLEVRQHGHAADTFDSQVANRLRESGYDFPEIRRTGNAGLSAQQSSPLYMEHVHERSFKQVTAGDGAMRDAQGETQKRFSDEVGDLARHVAGDLTAIWRGGHPSGTEAGKSRPEDANTAAWNAVCQDILKKSTELLTPRQRWKEASDAGRIKFVEQGPTHEAPAVSADQEALRVIVDGDRVAGTSRAKHALLKVTPGETAPSDTLYGAIYTNRNGCFFKTPTADYRVHFEGNKLRLENSDGTVASAELLGRVRRSNEKQVSSVSQSDKAVVDARNLNALPLTNIEAKGDLNFSPNNKLDETPSTEFHMVRLGETARSIALRRFQDPSLAALLVKVNKLPENSELLKGMRLRLPTPTDLAAYRDELVAPASIGLAV